jgi:micrococcal nuclease
MVPPMMRRYAVPLLVLLATLSAWSSPARCQDAPKPSAKIIRVVDGDTVVVRLDGQNVTVRIIGIDAPESVDPRKPVDRYGRELAYLRLEDGRDVGRAMLRDGFAHSYPKYPHSRLDDYRIAEREAREAKAGLWGADPPVEKVTGKTVVYVTANGKKYHAEGCRHLGSSPIPLPLSEASKGRTACSVCRPPKID